MALSPSFKTAIDTVDDSILLADSIDSSYGLHEFSYTCSGATYTIVGGSDIACGHGAAHLLSAMGFKFLGPAEEFWVKPTAPLSRVLTQSKTQFWMPDSIYSQGYGNSWGGVLGSWRALIEGATSQWYDLVGWSDQIYKTGHRQQSVVSAFSSFFAANPQYIDPRNSSGTSFALNTMTPAEKDCAATLAAAYILKNGQSATSALALYKRTEYDAADNDQNSSDDYYAHAVLVCQKVRAGVNALSTYGYGSYPEFSAYTGYAGVPEAQLGVYAYAKHKSPPSFDMRPYIYVGVALNFSPESSWLPRMEGYSAKTTLLKTRDYLDPALYTRNLPMRGRRQTTTYPDTYDAYYAQGVRGMHGGDGNGNWLINLVANRQLNMKLRTGSYTYAQAKADVLELMDNDPAVGDIYDLWMSPYSKFSRYSLYESMLIVDQMVDSWYKTYFEQIMVMSYLQLTRPDKPAVTEIGGEWDLHLMKELKHAVGIARSHIFHSWAFIRIYANSYISGYPHLYYDKNGDVGKTPAVEYYTNYTVPTHAEYTAARDALALISSRDPDLDSTDLSVVHNIVPRTTATAPAANFKVTGIAELVFIGPGTVTISGTNYVDDGTGGYTGVPYEEPPVSYPAGIHYLRYDSNFTYTNSGGYLFLSGFPSCAFDQEEAGDVWLYVPTRLAGSVLIENGSRIRVVDQLGSYDIGPTTTSNDSRMNNLGPGQIKIDGLQTRGGGSMLSVNQWISLDATKTLLPVEIAEEEFPVRLKINKV